MILSRCECIINVVVITRSRQNSLWKKPIPAVFQERVFLIEYHKRHLLKSIIRILEVLHGQLIYLWCWTAWFHITHILLISDNIHGMSIFTKLEIKTSLCLINRYFHDQKLQMIQRKKQLHLHKIKVKRKQLNLKILFLNVIIPVQLPSSKYSLKFFGLFILYIYCLL